MDPLGHVLILGLGSSGEAAARYCASLPADEVSSVTIVDAADDDRVREAKARLAELPVSVVTGTDEVVGAYDFCIASPGIPPHAPLMSAARAACDTIVSEIEFAYRRSISPWVAITGTNGKTTTTALVTHLLNCAGIAARPVGNIGTPAISVVADATAGEVLVAELSSFQLSLTEQFRPRVAVLLNVTPDHLDWHGSLENYAADKARIFANLTSDDTAIVDIDDAGSAPYAKAVEDGGVRVVPVSLDSGLSVGAVLDDGVLALKTGEGRTLRLVGAEELKIRGSHNVSNALAAAAAAHAMGAGVADLRHGLTTFEPIEHRLEPVAVIGGVEWFNDSKATNPDAVIKALSAFIGRPVVLLAGGRNKGNEFDTLAEHAAGAVRAIVAFGEARDEIAAAFRRAGVQVAAAETLGEAVDDAVSLAEPGDAILLSPACASFDEFKSYGHRGDVFKTLVRSMSEERAL